MPTPDLYTCTSGTSSVLVWIVPGIAGVNNNVRTFKFCYSLVSETSPFGTGTSAYGPVNASLLTAIVLPDLTLCTLAYDNYGNFSSLGLPTGGCITHTYVSASIPRN